MVHDVHGVGLFFEGFVQHRKLKVFVRVNRISQGSGQNHEDQQYCGWSK